MTINELNDIMSQIDGLIDLIKTVMKQRHKKFSTELKIPYGVGCDVYSLKIISLVEKSAPHLKGEADKLLSSDEKVIDILLLKKYLLDYFITGDKEPLWKTDWVYGRFDNKKEWDAYEKFCKKHAHSKEKTKSGKFDVAGWTDDCPYVKESLTALGVIRKVVCPFCGEEKDITDIDAW